MTSQGGLLKRADIAFGRWHVSRFRVLIAVLLAWAVGATSVGLWATLTLSHRAKVEAWNEEAVLIRHFGVLFRGVSESTDTFLESRDIAWGTQAFWLLNRIQNDFLTHSRYRASETFRSLGFSLATFYVAVTAYVSIVQRVRDNPDLLLESSPEQIYLTEVRGIYHEIADLTVDLESIDVDPIAQLGQERVGSINTLMGQLCHLSQAFVGGPCR